MNGLVLVRRAAVFAVSFGTGLALLAWSSGGLFVEAYPEDPSVAPANNPAVARVSDTGVVPVGQGAALGPGRGGRLDRDSLAIVRDKPVTWREMTAEWGTSTPVPSDVLGVSVQRLVDARFVFFPQPNDDQPYVTAREDAAGTTIVTGREALLRRKENAAPSVHAEGDCVATQVLGGGEAMVLRSEVLDFRTEERGKGKAPIRIVESDRAVRIEGGGAELTGTGLIAEMESGGDAAGSDTRRSAARRVARIEKDVRGVFRGETPKRPGAKAPEIHVACDDSADVETLDRPGRDGRQPWRATYRENVRFDEAATTMTAERVVVDFVRTGDADRSAGARPTEIRSVTATGSVKIDGRDPATAYHAQCERLRRFAEDARTDVTILEGAPVLTWRGRPQNAAPDAPMSVYDVRCAGPVTIRERRVAADRDAAATVTITFERDVVAIESVLGTGGVRSETKAPLVTVESRRDAAGKLDPRVLRAEQGATARYSDFAASAQTITAVAAEAGGMQHIALVGSPIAKYSLHAGGNPLGGAEAPGLLVLTSDGRIDADLAPDPPRGQKGTGPRATAKVTGGMVARKMTGDRESWRLTARDGDARIGWDDGIEEMHAVGAAHLVGAARDGTARSGDLSGERITVTRAPTGAKPSDPSKLDVLVEGIPEAPARAAFGSDQVTAATLAQSDDGTVLVARTGARALLQRGRGADGAAPKPAISAEADEMRVDLDVQSDGTRRPRVVVATGRVVLGDDFHRVTGDRVTYQVLRGEAEASGKPARLLRSEVAIATLANDPFPSYATGPIVRAWFDPDEKKAGADRFLRASLPLGGEIVAYHVMPARERVTTTCRGPLDLTRTTASCVQQVVCVHESRRSPALEWNSDSRIDCSRLDMTFDTTVKGAGASSKIRRLVAQGTPDDPAKIRTRSPAGDREAYAEAERIEGSQTDTSMHLSSPSEKGSVYFHDMTAGPRYRCDEITFDYVTFEWKGMLRGRGVE